MFDLGFEPQISAILVNVRPDRQTVMFSATFPKQIEGLAKKALKNPIEIVIGVKRFLVAQCHLLSIFLNFCTGTICCIEYCHPIY